MRSRIWLFSVAFTLFVAVGCGQKPEWQPVVDWGHWRLGQKADPEFLEKNHMTVTFGSGAPNFETATRAEFDQKVKEARAFNDSYHKKGYIVLRYLSTSLNGETATNKDEPRKDQIEFLRFYHERWDEFADLIGPRPQADPTTWITVRPDGSFPYYRYAPYGQETTGRFETWGCPDNPDYVRVMEAKIRAQAATGIDGCYVDWTHIPGGTCYCDWTRANFRRYLKEHIPPEVAQKKYGTADYDNVELPQKRGDKFWMEWLTFRCWTVAEFHRRLREAAHEINPRFLVSGNVFGGFGYGPIAYDAAGNMEMLGAEGYDDFLYSEIQEFLDSAPRKDESGNKISNSAALKFLAAASHGKPVIIYATEITPPIFPNPTEKCLSAMAQINIAEAVANHAIFREKRLTPPGATAMYTFLSANEEYLLGAKLHANVAVLASLNQFLADELSFAFSASRVLADRGIAHVMIVEDDLRKGDLSRYDLIWLPYLPLLSHEKQQALQRYVEKGGTLVILGECGKKDQFNLPQRPLLAQMLGAEEYPSEAVQRRYGKGIVLFQPLPIPEHRYLIPAKPKSEFTTFGPSMADVFPDIPEGYTRNRMHPDLRLKLEQTVDRMIQVLGNRLTRITSEHPFVEITRMENDARNLILIHLVNYDVTVDGEITPAQNLSLQVLLPGKGNVKAVRYCGDLSQLRAVPHKLIQAEGGTKFLTVTVHDLQVYGLVLVELR
ncbi:MAG: beta-galactosidase trimerization domain-containing protein [candidate division KSB1 bacterium]|nr:beta-galactosidase trimerization domain-containing protein [candidate division KSB1 bacterium]